MVMLIILAALCFIIAALIGFGVFSGVSILALIALGLFFFVLAGWGRIPDRYR